MQVAQAGKALRVPVVRPRVARLLLKRPDLTVDIAGPDRAVAGTNVTLTMTVHNKGTAVAQGVNTAPAGHHYFVDLVLSADSNIPVRMAIWPGYAGKTRDDFVEDMLLQGGRDAVRQDLAPGGSYKYSHPVYIPKNTPPGVYCVGAVVDPARAVPELREDNNTSFFKMTIAPAAMAGVNTGPGVWVMPYAVGGTPLNRIKPAGLTDYRDGSGLTMTNAPFGGRLGLRHGYQSSLPTAAIRYYRWLYRREGEAGWHEFSEPVGVHYEKQEAGHVSFPVYTLGPKSVGGKLLYEFRPHNAPTEPGATTSWPVNNWFGDIYSGFLNSPALVDGVYRIKLEVFSAAGAQVMPGPTSFRFIVPTGAAPGGEILTRSALPAEVDAGGFVFRVRVDNHACTAVIDNPHIGATNAADPCGFLRYAQRTTDQISTAFHAVHPQGYAVFGFRIVRATTTVSSAGGEVAAATSGVYAGDGHGNFAHDFLVNSLIRPQCAGSAAFAEVLHVYAKATRGWGNRIAAYDASAVRAFAIAPQPGQQQVQLMEQPSADEPVQPGQYKGPAPPELEMLGVPTQVPVSPQNLRLMAPRARVR